MGADAAILRDPEFVSCDVLVIGGGGGGLRATIAAKAAGSKEVCLVSKTRIGRACNTFIAKGVMAASGQADTGDSPQIHMADTLEGGCFLNDPAMVSQMTRRVPDEVSFLAGCGVDFARQGDALQVMKTPGHRHARHVYGANWHGSDLVLPLVRRAAEMGVRFFERVLVTKLFAAGGAVTGAAGLGDDGGVLVFQAPAVVLATGGYAQVFLNTNNAAGITGDGQALAYELGAPLKDMEFVQFYPTALGKRGSRLLLNEKLLAMDGVSLENTCGQDLFERGGYAQPREVTRDQLAQLVTREISQAEPGREYAVMNLSGLSDEDAGPLAPLLPAEWSKGQRKFQVIPTAHFCMGGIATDENCRTEVKGLFAVGEAAAGCHGANRLGGNALAEIFAMGSLAGERAAQQARPATDADSMASQAADEYKRLAGMFSSQGESPRHLTGRLKRTMWTQAGVIRSKEELEAALGMLQSRWPKASVTSMFDLKKYLELRNMLQVAEVVCAAALHRIESRGSHFRADYPDQDDDNWKCNVVVRKRAAGMELVTTPVGELSTG